MADARFDGYPTDARFPTPGVDNDHDSFPVDGRFPSPGEDARFGSGNLLTNGNFEDGETGWDFPGNNGGWFWEDNQAKCDGTQTAFSKLTQAVGTTGKTYEITFTVTEVSAGSIRAIAGNNAGTLVSVPGTYTQVLVAGNAFLGVQADASFVGAIDNAVVRELP